MRVTYVYSNDRSSLIDDVKAGRAPDTALQGLNHMHEFGIDANVHVPLLRRRERRRGLRHRITWTLREVPLPWEIRDSDVVYTTLHTLFPLTARLRGRPRVVVFNASICTRLDRSSPAARALLRASLRSVDGVVCNARSQRDRLIEQTGIRPDRVHLIHYGVDETFWAPAPPVEGGYVLAVGRDLARDYATFAAAMEGVAARGLILTARQNLAGVRLPANVEARFDVSQLEVRDLYAGASCVVLPTRGADYPYGSEGSGMTSLLEALAMARPAIVSARPDLADYLRPGETALSVPPEDPTSLRDAIDRILGNPGLAESLGSAGRRAVEQDHTTHRFAERLAGILRALDEG